MNWLKNSAYYLINKKKSISVSFCILLNFLADSQLSILSIAKFNLCMPCKLDCCLHQNFTTISWDPILSSTPPLKLILHRSLSKSSKNLRCNSALLQRLWMVCISVVAIWFLSWTPYAMVFILPTIGYPHLVTTHIDMIPAVFCKLSAAVNPFVYGLL